jgi:hypothetical protein
MFAHRCITSFRVEPLLQGEDMSVGHVAHNVLWRAISGLPRDSNTLYDRLQGDLGRRLRVSSKALALQHGSDVLAAHPGVGADF